LIISIFQIISGVGQFHHRQNRAERRGELDKKKQPLLGKKKLEQLLPNIDGSR
jgi:hypothetical protein